MILLLAACAYPDFGVSSEADTDTDADSDTDVDTDTDVDSDIEPLPRFSVADTGPARNEGSFAARLGSDGFSLGGGSAFLSRFDQSGQLTDNLELLNLPADQPIVAPIGTGQFEANIWHVVATSSATAGEGRIQLIDGNDQVTEIAAPSSEVPPLHFASTAAIHPSGLLVASRGPSSVLYHYENPLGEPTGSLTFDDINSGFGGSFVGLAHLDSDLHLEVLFGTEGDAFDPAALWGVEVPPTLGLTATHDSIHTKFRFRTDGAGDFTEPVGATGVVIDLDGDGHDDLVVGAPYNAGGRGEIHVVRHLSQAITVEQGNLSSDQFDAALVGPSDGLLGSSILVLDGFIEVGEPAVVVAAPGRQGMDGRVYAFRPIDLFHATDLDLTDHDGRWMEIHAGTGSSMNTGLSINNLGDLDGDGRDDLGIGERDLDFQMRIVRTGFLDSFP